MDVNKVTFGNFSIGARANNAQKDEVKEEAQKQAQVGGEQKSIDAEAVFNAMNISGIQNQLQISRPERREVDPADFLSAERIADIEAMMGNFEDGVGKVADAIEHELPGFFSADAKNALAARIFAGE